MSSDTNDLNDESKVYERLDHDAEPFKLGKAAPC